MREKFTLIVCDGLVCLVDMVFSGGLALLLLGCCMWMMLPRYNPPTQLTTPTPAKQESEKVEKPLQESKETDR